jgi:cytochrome P450/NADPH-cytochrome P450 reductase
LCITAKGAIIFVCGDGSKMKRDVKAALVTIYRESTGSDAAAGARWIEELDAKNCYVLGVWAGR